jgi:hypothetical protein
MTFDDADEFKEICSLHWDPFHKSWAVQVLITEFLYNKHWLLTNLSQLLLCAPDQVGSNQYLWDLIPSPSV